MVDLERARSYVYVDLQVLEAREDFGLVFELKQIPGCEFQRLTVNRGTPASVLES